MRQRSPGAIGPANHPLLFVRLAVVVCVLLFLPRLSEQFESVKAAALVVLGLAAAGAALAAIRLGDGARWQPLDVAVLAWLATDVVCTAFSDSPWLSLVGESSERAGLLTSVALAGVYLAARVGTRNAEDTLGNLEVVLLAGAVASGYALIQALGLDPIPWARTSAVGTGTIRPFGTLGHPNLLGIISGAVMAAGISLAFLGTRRRRLYGLAVVVAGLATLLTLSRGAWIGALAGSVVAGALAWGVGEREQKRRPLWRWVAPVVLAALAFLWFGGFLEVARQRALELLVPFSGTGRTRLEIWNSALHAWKERPWLGHGPDTFGLVFPRFQTGEYWRFEWAGLPNHAHSIYLQRLATGGVVGVVAWLGLAIAGLAAARSAWRSEGASRRLVPPLLGVITAVISAGAFGSIGVSGALLVVVAAAGVASLAEGERVATAPLSSSRTGSRGMLATAAVLAVPALFMSVLDLAASTADRRGQDLILASNRLPAQAQPAALRRAADAYARAGKLALHDDGVLRRHATALRYVAAVSPADKTALADAERLARRSIVMAPLRAANHRCLGSVLMASVHDPAKIAEGESAYAEAVRLAPFDATTLIELSQVQLDAGRTREALAPAARACDLSPWAAETCYQLARVQIALGDAVEATRALTIALGAEWHGKGEEQRRAGKLLESLRISSTPPTDPGRSAPQ